MLAKVITRLQESNQYDKYSLSINVPDTMLSAKLAKENKVCPILKLLTEHWEQ